MIRKKVKIKDLGTVITGKTPPTKQREYYGEEYTFIKPTYIDIDSRFFESSPENLSSNAYEKYKNSFIKPYSTCVVTIGSIGDKICMNKELCLTNQAINTVIPNQEEYDNMFIFYLLKNNLHKVKGADTGTSSGRENVGKSVFENIEVEVPDLVIQKKIGKILSSYDDLIENNLRRIKLLEESAELIYKEWFINLRFPGYEKYNIVDGIPEGWQKKSIGELLEYQIGGGWGETEFKQDYTEKGYVIRGTDIENILTGNLNNIPVRYHKLSNIKERKLRNRDIVLEVSNGQINNIGRSLIISQNLLNKFKTPIICASFCKLIRINEEYSSELIHLHIKEIKGNNNLKKYINTSAAGINNFRFKEFLDEEKVLIPDQNIYSSFVGKVEYIYNMIDILRFSANNLKEARDILIPRLISGEIEV